MNPLIETLLINLGVVVSLMTGMWLLSLVRRDAGIVDPFWGTGFVIVAWVSHSLNQPSSTRSILIVSLVTLWGLRLSVHLLIRNFGHDEDRRYAAMRRKHGERFWLVSLFTVFLLQGWIMWFVSLPIQAVSAAADGQPALGWLDLVGVAIWLVGFLFESVGDWQLTRFKSLPKNRGEVLDHGLWRFTRHPNYFGDFCVWWGLFTISLGAAAFWTVGSPLLMSLLLMKVSGVSLLEKNIEERRPAYAEYKRRTNAFFPWWPQGEQPSSQ